MPRVGTGLAPATKGVRYPADPPKIEEIIAVMRAAGGRAGLRIPLTEGDVDERRGSLLVGRGKGGRRREVGMDAWG